MDKIRILQAVQDGTMSVSEAEALLAKPAVSKVGDVANLDLERASRCGMPEIVLAEGKDTESLVQIMHNFVGAAGRCVASRISREQTEAVCAALPAGVTAEFREAGNILILTDGTMPVPSGGKVAILTAPRTQTTRHTNAHSQIHRRSRHSRHFLHSYKGSLSTSNNHYLNMFLKY